eukprot:1005257-Pelagomonas_calceolata.AAC.1
MDLAFFHNTLKMRSFNEQALQEFQEVVQEYVQDDEFARRVRPGKLVSSVILAYSRRSPVNGRILLRLETLLENLDQMIALPNA